MNEPLLEFDDEGVIKVIDDMPFVVFRVRNGRVETRRTCSGRVVADFIGGLPPHIKWVVNGQTIGVCELESDGSFKFVFELPGSVNEK